ncbi:MAG: hypothetical protein RR291_01015, partial [Clostridia bacterium]
MSKLLTPLELWGEFDPNDTPLNTDVFKTVDDGEVKKEYVFFSGRLAKDGVTRVFGVIARPSKEGIYPSLFICKNISKPLDEEELSFWAKRGFVAMSIDYFGEIANMRHTLYPTSRDYCNYSRAGRRATFVDDTVRETVWYEYVINSMRAMSVLESKNQGKIRIIAIKEANKVGIILSAMDKRIEATSVIFGDIWEEEKSESEQMNLNTGADELNAQLAMSEELDRRIVGLAPQSYLQYINSPIYIIININSHHSITSQNVEAIGRINNARRLMIFSNCVANVNSRNIETMSNWLKNPTDMSTDSVSIKLSESNGQIIATATVTGEKDLFTTIWYNRGSKVNKQWLLAHSVTDSNGTTTAILDLYSSTAQIEVFATVHGKISYSSEIVSIIPEKITSGKLVLKNKTRLLFSGESEENIFMPMMDKTDSDWHKEIPIPVIEKGLFNIKGIKGKNFGTFAIRDDKVDRLGTDTLCFDISSKVTQPLVVEAVENWNGEEKRYFSKVMVTDNGKWNKVVLSKSRFKTADGEELRDNDDID